MDLTSSSYPAGDLRVSDSDRDVALSELSEHFQAGRLTAAELDDRAGRALAARTGRELADLMADLPQRPPAQSGPTANSGTGTGARRMAGRSAAMTTAGAFAATGVVLTVLALLGDGAGKWYVGPSPWGLVLVGFIILRRMTRGSRNCTRSR